MGILALGAAGRMPRLSSYHFASVVGLSPERRLASHVRSSSPTAPHLSDTDRRGLAHLILIVALRLWPRARISSASAKNRRMGRRISRKPHRSVRSFTRFPGQPPYFGPGNPDLSVPISAPIETERRERTIKNTGQNRLRLGAVKSRMIEPLVYAGDRAIPSPTRIPAASRHYPAVSIVGRHDLRSGRYMKPSLGSPPPPTDQPIRNHQTTVRE